MYPWWPDLNRAGWCAAQVAHGKLVGGMYGTVPGQEQSVPRAELYALRAAMPLLMPPVRIWMDHANHVRAIQKGRRWCLAPMRPHVDLWQHIWRHIDEMGGVGDAVQ
eukprot:11808315-Karenia_brevis.AAC.1